MERNADTNQEPRKRGRPRKTEGERAKDQAVQPLLNRKRGRPAKTLEGRENQLIALAYDVAEEQLLARTASSQIITELMRRGSTKEELEKEKLREENELLKAKVESLKNAETTAELYEKALEAMRSYSGTSVNVYEDQSKVMTKFHGRIKTYSEMIELATFEERFQYLKIGGALGEATFGSSRYLNQRFYNSWEWKQTRRAAIIRDSGCDLADPDREISEKIIIHHINPIDEDDLFHNTELLLNLDFLVCTCGLTHNAIHFGDESLLPTLPPVRKPNDMIPWRT